MDDRRDRTYARPDARTRVATPDAAATIIRGSVLLSSLPAMVPVGSAPPPAIGERLCGCARFDFFVVACFVADVSQSSESRPTRTSYVPGTISHAIFDLDTGANDGYHRTKRLILIPEPMT